MSILPHNKRNVIFDFSLGWTFALIFLSIFRGVGTTETGTVQFDLLTSLIISVGIGSTFGAINGYAQVLLEERFYRRISISKLLLLRFTYALLFIIFLVIVAYAIVTLGLKEEVDFITFVFDDGSFAIYSYVLFVDLILILLRQINLMMGKGNLLKLITGRFYTPREEERIFMFLDLQSSTQLAEKLGHIQYSRLIQDCFTDLGIVDRFDAEIYQYVGDEVILTWPLKNGLKKQNCIAAYFAFKRRLEKKSNYYQEHYGAVPFFKAGIHAGIVTVTEVGKYKREIAYHGDTINTAARIQAQCNTFQKGILISEHLKNLLTPSSFTWERIGNVSLKGKQNEVIIYAINTH